MLACALSPIAGLADRLASLAPLETQAREALLDVPVATARMAGNRQIVAEGEPPSHVYIVIEGLIAQIQHTRRGDQQITGLYLPGEPAGLGDLVRPRAGSSLQTIAPSVILVVSHDALRRVEQRYPALTPALWAECLLQRSIAAEWLLNIGRRRALSRTAHLFCELACRHGGRDREPRMRFPLPARQNHLADMLALTTVHLNRTLRMLREEALASFHERDLCIHDWDRLAALADFDPSYLE